MLLLGKDMVRKHVQLYQEETLMENFHGRVISKKSMSMWVRK